MQLKSNEARALWRTKQVIKKEDSEWQPTVDFKQYANAEFQALHKANQRYLRAEKSFNTILTTPQFSTYARSLPRALWQAQQIIQNETFAQNYQKYNEAVLAQLQNNIKNIDLNNFTELAKVADLEQLASNNQNKFGRFPKGYQGLSPEVKNKANTLLAQGLSPSIVSAAKLYAEQKNDLVQTTLLLKPLRYGQFKALTNVLSATQQQQIDAIFKQRKQKVINDALSQDFAVITRINQQSQRPEQKLQQLVLHHANFTKKYLAIINEPETKLYLKKTQVVRLRLLQQLQPSIIQKINTATSLSSLKVSLIELATPDDLSTPEVKKIKQAQTDKLAQLMKFKPVLKASDLSLNSFTAKNLNYESELTALYLGDFKHARLERNSMATTMLLTDYLNAFGRNCHAYLPANKVPITKSKCATERVTTNGWGTETGRNCVRWVDIPTGLYADPILYNLSNRAGTKAGLDMMAKSLSKDMFASRTAIDDQLSLGNDMNNLVTNNKCNNAGLKRFEQNLYRFMVGESPLILPSKVTLADVRSIYQADFKASINFSGLIDDLILENSKGWMLNRYIKGSVSGVRITNKTREGLPITVVASYRYNSLGKSAYGSVSLTFANERPKCLFFSDARNTCRHPSRGITNKYEKGQYLK